jgi:hypothetical protein
MRIVTLILSLLGAYLVVLDGFRLLLIGTMAQAVGPTAGDAALRVGHAAQGLGALIALGGVVALVAPRLAVALFVLVAGVVFWTAAATGSTQPVGWGAGAVLLAVTAALGAAEQARRSARDRGASGELPDDPGARSVSA